LFGVALTGVVAAVGCSNSSNNTPPAEATSAMGESCLKSGDCKDDLVCVGQVCIAKGGATPAGDGGTGGDTGHPGNPPPGDGGNPTGPGTVPGKVSSLGESCTATTDCGDKLICVLLPPGSGESGGVCDLKDFGLTASGKTCDAECKTGADCCELPLNIPPIGATAIHQCNDLLQVLNGDVNGACSGLAPGAVGDKPTACFYYKTYCQCDAKTWTCTNNACVYTGSCSDTTLDNFGGCPSRTRTGFTQPSNRTCDKTAMTCTPKPGTASGCTAAADCNGKPAAASTVFATCASGTEADCTCLQGACYITCARDLDFESGFTCNSDKVCQPAGACATDADCENMITTKSVGMKCNMGTCINPCTSDHDCSPSSGANQWVRDRIGNFNGQICSNGACTTLGCSSDVNCATPNGLHTFCAAPPSGVAVSQFHSAITSGTH
jgi:hypothetical protein